MIRQHTLMAMVTIIMVDIEAYIMAYIKGGTISHILWLLWQLIHSIVLILLSLTIVLFFR